MWIIPTAQSFPLTANAAFSLKDLRLPWARQQPRDSAFLIRLKGDGLRHVILETKGYDMREQKKIDAAERWVKAVNASGKYGQWSYRLVKKPEDVIAVLTATV